MVKVALQLYSVRDYVKTHEELENTLKKLCECGYKYVETAGYYGMTAEQLSALTQKYGLSIISCHTGMDAFVNNFDGTVAELETFGAKNISVPAMPGNIYQDTLEGYACFGQVMDGFAERLAEKGVTLSYHNHDTEFHKVNGTCRMEAFLENAKKVNFQIDTGNALRGGADAAAWMNRYADRMRTVHYKDVVPDEKGYAGYEDSAIGEGVLDWAAIAAETIKAGTTEYVIIEIESFSRDVWDVLKVSRENVEKMLA